uniref:Small ribosomal subunit protein bS16c n=2 Tax=Laurencieae TaxID=2008388 RepID=A0AA51RH51_9FLOR|nr:30S ribosomal protein S16 [Laurencia elata]WMP11670.1 30S ribosomal protein S16 [Laurencia tasmanica]WMP12363.1 30S ribosomal protein S16 [Laurencia verruciformis]WMP12788.1 30S ribosomal protein S16 [Laurencia elata]
MLKIRLKKLGRKRKACYRIIAIDSRSKRDGKAIEELGFYNPQNKYKQINTLKIEQRIKQGAQLTKTVQSLVDKNSN